MGDYILNDTHGSPSESDDFSHWNSEQFAKYISKQGLEEYQKCIIQHKITSNLAPLLSDLDLKEMGIKCID